MLRWVPVKELGVHIFNVLRNFCVFTMVPMQIITVGAQSGGQAGYTSFESLLSPSPSNGNVTLSASTSLSAVATAVAAAAPSRLAATICYSSGTTGKPKGCVHTHSAYVAVSCQKK